MRTPNNNPENYDPQHSYSAKKLSRYDMQVAGVVVYVVAMTMFFVIALVLMLFGSGTVTEAHAQTAVAKLHITDVLATAEQKNKLAELTQPLPSPQSNPEDTNDSIAVLHAREDLLLESYSWVDHEHGKTRIPIERAMVLLAQRGLPMAPAVAGAPMMTGDRELSVNVPLTNGFARTANEQDQLRIRN
jgi:hypothetical protein